MTNEAGNDIEKGHEHGHRHTDFENCEDNDHWGKNHNHGFCEKVSISTYNLCHTIYMLIRSFLINLCVCFGLCWYPTKERLNDCCDCCGKRYSQHLDPAFSTFD